MLKSYYALSLSVTLACLGWLAPSSLAQDGESSPLPSETPTQPRVVDLEATTLEPTADPNRAPNYLNPSANPLLFPTAPEEVNTTIVQPITLNQAIDLALRNNRELEEGRLLLERTRSELEEQRARNFPLLSTEGFLERNSNTFSTNTIEFDNQLGTFVNRQVAIDSGTEFLSTAGGSFNLEYNIYAGGERAAQINRAKETVRRSQLEVEVRTEQVRFDAADAYYQLQRSDAAVAIAAAAIEDASQSLRDAQLLEQAGLGTRFSVLQAEVDLSRANQDLTQAIADQRIARRRLAELLSVGQKVELTAADEIKEAGLWTYSLDESIVLAYKNRAELEQQLVQREISKEEREIALAGIKPRVDFVAGYQFQDNFYDANTVEDNYFLQARVRWTFFDGGRAFAQAKQADRNQDIAETQFARLRNQIRREVEQAYYESVASKENIATATKTVESATESLRLARLRFQAGVGTQTDVINSQRDLTDARSRYLQAIVDYNRSLNGLQRAVSNLPDRHLFELR
jgi:OMF family outer membrane factor